ncbi:MAG TPA: protein YgfX [Burkholderiales bacterium]|nr:protein YgfX [Burkholderiales bacterium]
MSALRLQLAPSRPLAALIVLAHAAAAAAVYALIKGPLGVAASIGFVALGAAAAWSRALLAASNCVRAIELGGAEPVFELANGERIAAPVAARRYVTRYVVALPLGGKLRRTLLVSADMLGAEEFRRLRLWALWNRLPAVAPKQLAA